MEIRDAQNGRLKQVIAGKDIRLLDDGGGGSGGGAQTQPQAMLGGGMNGLGLKNFGKCAAHAEAGVGSIPSTRKATSLWS